MRDTIRILQEAMDVYRNTRPDYFLPTARIDGILGPETAALAIRIAGIERFPEIFLPVGVPSAASTNDALATLRTRLATLSPLPYAEEMRGIILTQAVRHQRLMGFTLSVLQRAFQECTAYDMQSVSFSEETITAELRQLSSNADHLSPLIPRDCTDILQEMPPADRRRAQALYLAQRLMPPESEEQEWCDVIKNRRCLMVRTHSPL